MTRTVEAWDVSPGQTLRFKHWGKTVEGIVTATRDAPRDYVVITLTCGAHKFPRSAILELVEVGK